MATLLFIDTNILLDFYRFHDQGLGLLDLIWKNHRKIIMTTQVEMEFHKHRQQVLINSLGQIKTDFAGTNVPAFLRATSAFRALEREKKSIQKQQKRMRDMVDRYLRTPSRSDPVFKVLRKVFSAKHLLNLQRPMKERLEVREMAQKRWLLGYPPRKTSDTSIGDAVNWEWIVMCANKTGAHVTIVSRDSDYGVSHGSETFINDWLLREFHARVTNRRRLKLTSRLTEALKEINAPVTKQEVSAEEQVIREVSAAGSGPNEIDLVATLDKNLRNALAHHLAKPAVIEGDSERSFLNALLEKLMKGDPSQKP
jgi:hypothetical protein